MEIRFGVVVSSPPAVCEHKVITADPDALFNASSQSVIQRSAKIDEDDDRLVPLSTSSVAWQIGGRSYVSWERHHFTGMSQVRDSARACCV